MMDDASYHAWVLERFEDSEESGATMREKAERDVDYYDGRQWTDKELKALEKRGQPAITWNRVREKIDYLQGLERENRSRPVALPRTPMHEQDAHAATDAIRYVADANRYDETRSTAWADILRAGWGGAEIVAEPNQSAQPGQPEYRVVIRRNVWDRMFWDPYSAEEDFSDASYLGLVIWMDRREAVRRYGEEASKVFEATIEADHVGGTFDDRPKYKRWATHGARKRIRVVQMYYLAEDGEWNFCEFTRAGILRDGPSPWVDEEGKREHPYAWRAAYVDRDNNRYGPIRDMIDMQDEINKRRSKALHIFTTRQTFTAQGSLGGDVSTAAMRRALNDPNGNIELGPNVEWGKQIGIIPTGDLGAAHFELLQQATSAFETMGPNASMQGKRGESESGRAILAQQRGGQIQMGTLMDALRMMDLEAYRKVWRRIRQFWTGETWVRVTDDERNMRWVGINVPMVDELGQPVVDQFGQPAMQNPVAAMDMDITMSDAPDMGTMQDEQFRALVDLANVGVVFPPTVYIEASQLRNKDELLEMLSQQGAPDPIQQQAAMLEMQNTEADTANKFASAQKSQAQAAEIAAQAQARMVQAAQPQLIQLA